MVGLKNVWVADMVHVHKANWERTGSNHWMRWR